MFPEKKIAAASEAVNYHTQLSSSDILSIRNNLIEYLSNLHRHFKSCEDTHGMLHEPIHQAWIINLNLSDIIKSNMINKHKECTQKVFKERLTELCELLNKLNFAQINHQELSPVVRHIGDFVNTQREVLSDFEVTTNFLYNQIKQELVLRRDPTVEFLGAKTAYSKSCETLIVTGFYEDLISSIYKCVSLFKQ